METSISIPLPPATALSSSDLPSVLSVLFNHSPVLHSAALPTLTENLPFPTYAALIEHIRSLLLSLAASTSTEDTTRLQEILAAHPRLGAGRVESELSQGEQAQLRAGNGEAGSDESSKEEELIELQTLNREYEDRFGGLRFVVFVNGRGRSEIISDIKARIRGGDIEAERKVAIQAACDIALDRATKLSPKV